MLHILNGASVEKTLQESTVPGDFFSFRDALITGPAPAELQTDDWCRIRAAHLADSYGVDQSNCESGLRQQSATLATAINHDEVVLWFEHDLFCQLNLLYLLNWFSNAELKKTKLSLVNIGEFPGRPNFRGLGELSAEELSSLFPTRASVTSAQLRLAEKAWAAFCSPDPTSIENVIKQDNSALPFLGDALVAHLRRFPTTRNGLGEVENKSLELISNGHERFSDLFPAFNSVKSIYGFGDAQLWLAVAELANARMPVVINENSEGQSRLTNHIVSRTAFKLTDVGTTVLRGEADYAKLNEIDRWLGGVHLHGTQLWRWDENIERLKYC